jgi:hypothetical protein
VSVRREKKINQQIVGNPDVFRRVGWGCEPFWIEFPARRQEIQGPDDAAAILDRRWQEDVDVLGRADESIEARTAKPPTKMYSTFSAWNRRRSCSSRSSSIAIPARNPERSLDLATVVQFVQRLVPGAEDAARMGNAGTRQQCIYAPARPQGFCRIGDVGTAIEITNDAHHGPGC